MVLLTACASVPVPPPDTSGSDWVVRQGQALWRTGRGTPEIAGEVVLASNPSGDFVLELTKTPLSLLSAHRAGDRWQVVFPIEPRRITGRGSSPARLLWLRLPDALSGRALPQPLVFRTGANDWWRLENPHTGEAIEGFLSP